MKELRFTGSGRCQVSVGLLGSRRVLAAEGRAGPLLAVVRAAAGEGVRVGAGWGVLASCMGAVVVAGGPFWVP